MGNTNSSEQCALSPFSSLCKDSARPNGLFRSFASLSSQECLPAAFKMKCHHPTLRSRIRPGLRVAPAPSCLGLRVAPGPVLPRIRKGPRSRCGLGWVSPAVAAAVAPGLPDAVERRDAYRAQLYGAGAPRPSPSSRREDPPNNRGRGEGTPARLGAGGSGRAPRAE